MLVQAANHFTRYFVKIKAFIKNKSQSKDNSQSALVTLFREEIRASAGGIVETNSQILCRNIAQYGNRWVQQFMITKPTILQHHH